MVKASVNISTWREGGLDWQLKLLSQQTFKDFEIVIVDGYYEERKDAIAAQAAELGLVVKHVPVPQLNYMTELTHATNRNEALKHVGGEVVIFFDDYQQPAPNFVETHVRTCQPQIMVGVYQHSYHYRPDIDYAVWATLPVDSYEHIDYRNPNNLPMIRNMDPRSLWTNSSSVHISDIRSVVGFDERYNGGTGGEDGDLGLRLHRAGCRMLYTTRTEVRHISHHHVPARKVLDDIPKTVNQALCKHDRDPFTVNQYHVGDKNLVESGSLYTYRDDEGVKYYVCSNCGRIGVIDSIEVLNASTLISQVPAKLFGVNKDGHHTYAKFPAPKELWEKLTAVYDGTPYTYYQEALRRCR